MDQRKRVRYEPLFEHSQNRHTYLEQSRFRTTEMGNQKNWLHSTERFRAELERMDATPDTVRKQFLEIFVDRINVSYDHATKEHELVVKFRLPLIDEDQGNNADGSSRGSDLEISLPPNDTTPQLRFSPDSGVGPHQCL